MQNVWIDGEKLNPEHIKNIGYMPEERGLYKNMTVGDQLLYFGELKGMSRQEALSQAKFWFEQLNIDQWWKKKLSELSKGMAQKVQFVVTVLHRPKLLILDEPTNHLDMYSIDSLCEAIKEFEGSTILVTHSEMMLRELADALIVFHHDKFANVGC